MSRHRIISLWLKARDFPEIPDTDFIEYKGEGEGEGEGGWKQKDGKNIDSYYLVVNSGDAFSSSKLLSQILPFGSIDETVRLGGTILSIIQKSTRILNVFYTESSGNGRYLLSGRFSDSDVDTLIDSCHIRMIKVLRLEKHYTEDSVVGYFGEEGAESLS